MDFSKLHASSDGAKLIIEEGTVVEMSESTIISFVKLVQLSLTGG